MRSQDDPHRSQADQRAVALIQLGARLQVLESETDLSYERLLRLYKEVAGKSPSKGQLPFSTDWFMTWQPNIHASLFLNIHEYLNKVVRARRDRRRDQGLPALPGADHGPGPGVAAVGDPRLAAGEVRRQRHADDDQVLQCGGQFVTHPHEIAKHYVCGLCCPPARAGKGKASGVDPDALTSPQVLRRNAERTGSPVFLACLLQHTQCFEKAPSGAFFLPQARPAQGTDKGRSRRQRPAGAGFRIPHHHDCPDRLRRRTRLHLRSLHPARRQHRRDPARPADRADGDPRRLARRVRRQQPAQGAEGDPARPFPACSRAPSTRRRATWS